MHVRPSAIPLVFLLLIATPMAGQATTATLVGRVTANGVPLPGVLVVLTSPSLLGSRVVTTADDGQYLVPALPPGDYAIRFEMEGMEPLDWRATLPLAQMTRVDARMTPAAFEADINVTAASPTLLETPQVSTNFTGEAMELLPTGRGITDAVMLAPGVLVDSSGFASISGAEVFDNLYLVNGVSVGSRRTNQPLNLFIEDAIQETTILSSGISAEHGRFSGGVVNVLTKSGGNELSGSLRDTLASDSWVARTPFAGELDHLDEISHELQATLGGRVVRDRLWFFLSGRHYDRDSNRATPETFVPFISNNYEDRGEAKLTGSITSNQTIVASYLRVDETRENVNSPLDTRALYDEINPRSLFAVHYTAVAGSSLVAEAQYSKRTEGRQRRGGGDGTLLGGLPVQDLVTGAETWATVFCGVCFSSYGDARDVQAKASWLGSSPRLGIHEVLAGFDDYHDLMRSDVSSGSSNLVLSTPIAVVGQAAVVQLVPDQTYVEWSVYSPSQEGDFNSRAIFLNDRITFGDHLTASLGLRYDRTHATNTDGTTVADDSRISPRAGLVYDLFGDGRDRINASFSRYVAKVQESAATAAEDSLSPTLYYWNYDGDAVNEDPENALPTEEVLRQFLDWFAARGGTADTSDAAGSFRSQIVLDGTLDSPYADEVALGYGHRIGENGTAQVNLLRREWSSFYTLNLTLGRPPIVNPDGTRADPIVVTTEDEGLMREYKAAQFQGNYRRGRFTVAGNYTYATLRGNVEAATTGGANPQQSPLNYRPEFTRYAQRSPIGYLSNDVRHTANAWLIFRLPGVRHQLTVSLLETFHTGRPYNMVSQIDLRGVRPNPGYISSFVQAPYYYRPRGSLRTEDTTATNLGLHYSLRLGATELLAHANVFNLFNEQALENPGGIDTVVRTPTTDRNLVTFNPFTTTPIECPQGVPTSSTQCRGIANYQVSPRFGEARGTFAYQRPRTYTLSVALRF
jgi:hypothetical protein